jgi:hypothetical protein
MRTGRVVLAVVLAVAAILPATVGLAHAHDASAPGLYSTQCPLVEAAAHAVAVVLQPPSAAGVEVATTPIPGLPEARALDGAPALAASRAPPLR